MLPRWMSILRGGILAGVLATTASASDWSNGPKPSRHARPVRKSLPEHARRVKPDQFWPHPGDLSTAPVVVPPPRADPGEGPIVRRIEIPAGREVHLEIESLLGEVLITSNPEPVVELVHEVRALAGDPTKARSEVELMVTVTDDEETDFDLDDAGNPLGRGDGPENDDPEVEPATRMKIHAWSRYFALRDVKDALPYLKRGERPAEIRLTVKVPDGVTPVIRTWEAGIVFTAYTGNACAKSDAGPFRVESGSGRLKIESGSGRILVKGSEHRLELESETGRLLARDFRGTLEARIRHADARVFYGAMQDHDQRLYIHQGRMTVLFPPEGRVWLDVHADIDQVQTILPFEGRQVSSRRFQGHLNYRGPLIAGQVPKGADKVTFVDLWNEDGPVRLGFDASPAPAAPAPSPSPAAPPVGEIEEGLEGIDI